MDSEYHPIHLETIAGNLRLNSDGIWVSRSDSAISYPAEGNNACFAVEESSFWFRHRNACLIEAFKRFPPPGAIFDVGGGNGVVSKALLNNGIDAVLVEPGSNGVRNAKARGIHTLVQSTLEDAQFHPETLPAVGIFDVLEHIEDDRGFLRSISSYLVPGGRLYIAVPAYQFLWSDEDATGGHYRRYTLSSLCRRLREAGFEIEYRSYFFAPLPLPIFLFRTIPSLFKARRRSQEQTESEHSADDSGVGGLLDRVLGFELRWLKSGRRIPFGGSCLVVARKQGA